jgi:hypothetical protein
MRSRLQEFSISNGGYVTHTAKTSDGKIHNSLKYLIMKILSSQNVPRMKRSRLARRKKNRWKTEWPAALVTGKRWLSGAHHSWLAVLGLASDQVPDLPDLLGCKSNSSQLYVCCSPWGSWLRPPSVFRSSLSPGAPASHTSEGRAECPCDFRRCEWSWLNQKLPDYQFAEKTAMESSYVLQTCLQVPSGGRDRLKLAQKTTDLEILLFSED